MKKSAKKVFLIVFPLFCFWEMLLKLIIHTFQEQTLTKYLKRNMHFELNILKSCVDDMMIWT